MAATAVVTKTPPSKRHRPSISTRANVKSIDSGEDGGERMEAPSDPFVRTTAHILKKFRGNAPSLTVHLHPTFFRFDGQEGTFSYKSEMRIFLEHMAKSTIPHALIEEFLRSGVAFYDGCLIVEVHNHRNKDVKAQKKVDSSDADPASIPFSIHNYNEHVTPSPYVPYPRKAEEHPSKKLKTTPDAEESEKEKKAKLEMPAPETKPKKASEVQKYTTVLFPTDLSKHHELMMVASLPAPDPKARKTSRESGVNQTTTSALQARAAAGKPIKMLLEGRDIYNFEAEYLLTTEAPLMLDVPKDASHAQAMLQTLAHPLHSGAPPTGQTKKRTQADIAADDAQAAREEHKMLIMDERIKPSADSDTQSGTAALGFTRFKTLETIKQRHEEKERQRKEDEARAALEKRQQEILQKKKAAEEMQQQRKSNEQALLQQQQVQQQMLMRQQALQQQQQQQKAQLQQQMAMAQNPQQQQVLQQAAMNHSSPVVRNQTPMMNSSPMTANANVMQGGFPMQNSASNQGVGSPLRPNSAMHHPGVGMARQISQQQHPSRNGTPQIPGATPHMANAVPMDINRQVTATPHMNNASPAQNMQGTPNANMMNMNMNTPQMNTANLNPQQMAFLQNQQAQRRAMQQLQAAQNLSPEQMQMRQAQLARANMNPQAVNAANYQAQLQRFQAMQMQNSQRVQQQQQQQQVMNQQPQGQQQVHTPGAQNAASPMAVSNSQNPNMANDQAAAAQRSQQQAAFLTQIRQQAQRQMQQQLAQVAAQNGGQVPNHIKQQIMLQHQQRMLSQQQQIAMRAQQAAQSNQSLDINDPENYMRNLRGQAMMARMNNQQQQQQQQANGGANQQGAANQMSPQNMAMAAAAAGRPNLTMQQMQQMQAMRQAQQQAQAQAQAQQQQQQNQQNAPLSQEFAALQDALNIHHQQQGM